MTTKRIILETALVERWGEHVYQSDMDEELYECTTLVFAMVDHYLTTGQISDIILEEMVQAVEYTIQQLRTHEE